MKKLTLVLLIGGGFFAGYAQNPEKPTTALERASESPAEGESYVVWIAQSPSKMLPLPISPVVENGKIAERVQVPTELLAYLADGTFHELAITRVSVAKLNTALNQATKGKEEVSYTGTPVMRGEITGPIVGAAKRLEEEKASGK